METANTIDAHQLGELARFLDEHPGFSPLFSDDAILCGSRVGECSLSLEDMKCFLACPRERRLSALLAASAERAGGL